MTKRRVIIAVSSAALLALGYYVGWHTSLGRAVRGVSTVAFANRSSSPLQYIHFYLTDSRGREVDRHFEHLQPQQTAHVGVRTSDLIIQRIVCEQGQRAFTYDAGANVTPGEVFLVAVDSQGAMSSEYDH